MSGENYCYQGAGGGCANDIEEVEARDATKQDSPPQQDIIQPQTKTVPNPDLEETIRKLKYRKYFSLFNKHLWSAYYTASALLKALQTLMYFIIITILRGIY